MLPIISRKSLKRMEDAKCVPLSLLASTSPKKWCKTLTSKSTARSPQISHLTRIIPHPVSKARTNWAWSNKKTTLSKASSKENWTNLPPGQTLTTSRLWPTIRSANPPELKRTTFTTTTRRWPTSPVPEVTWNSTTVFRLTAFCEFPRTMNLSRNWKDCRNWEARAQRPKCLDSWT